MLMMDLTMNYDALDRFGWLSTATTKGLFDASFEPGIDYDVRIVQ